MADAEHAQRSMKNIQCENAALQDKLRSAQKLVRRVMSEGGALLDSYHLEYGDIEFCGGDDGEKYRLGEGA